MWFALWIGCIVATMVIASNKKLSVVGYFFLALFLGPAAVIIVLLLPAQKAQTSGAPKMYSLNDARTQLDVVKRTVLSLQQRIQTIESAINRLAEQEIISQSQQQEVAGAQAVPQGDIAEKNEQEGFEFVFGKYWLNRIGVVLFVLGISLFISYSFQYLQAFFKIMIGYLLSICFFLWGNVLERKPKYTKIAWGILGGAWGLLYLSAYAMHYIEATRIIDNPALGLWLLALVSVVTVVYNFKYKSWVVTSITFLLAFITAGLGGIDYSTIIFWALLMGSIVFLSYKLEWYKFLLFAISGSYLTYLYWINPKIFLISGKFDVQLYQFQLSFGMLFISWIMFSIPLFLLKTNEREKERYVVAGFLLNAGFFISMGLSEIHRVRHSLDLSWDPRFWFLFVLAIVYFGVAWGYRRVNKPKLIVAPMSIAFSLLAMAIVMKCARPSIAFFWILEMAIVFVVGVYYKELVYRLLAGVLSLLIFIRIFFFDFFSKVYYTFFNLDVKHSTLIFIFAAFCYFLLGALVKNKEIEKRLTKKEIDLYSCFPVLGTILITFLLETETASRWLTLSWTLEGVGILVLGILLQHKVYRICALSVLCLACLRLIFFDMSGVNTIYKIAAFTCLGGVLLIVSLIYSKFVSKQ